ncbi:NnrS family protein, partial [Mycobacterium tuberculosis]|nr:NnrS family protein [Mycobacterium tuberculosis]
RVRQRRQIGILAKLALLWLAFVIFAIGAWRSDIAWQKTGVYLAFYLIIGVVLTIGRRVMPMFISNGINHHLPKNAPKVELKNAVWVDRV